MSVHFSAVWKDSGFFASLPPLLVVPIEGIALVYLVGVRSFGGQSGMRFDSGNLTLTALDAGDILRQLMIYAENFPARQRADVLALAGGMQTSLQRGSSVLSVQASVPGAVSSLDYRVNGAAVARMDVLGARRRTVAVSFRFVRYQNAAGFPVSGTALTPDDAAGLLEVMNRLFMPSANIALTLRSAEYAIVSKQLGAGISKATFLQDIAPRRDRGAGCTVFFVGKWQGGGDPHGSAFDDLKSVVVDDAPAAFHRAPQTAWPANRVTDEQLAQQINEQSGDSGKGPPWLASDRDLHIVLAHEIAHILGADHDDEQDTLMSNKRQDLKLSRPTIAAIIGG